MFRRLAAACLFAIAVTANAQSISAAPVDCLFNWAETNYPNLFSPAGVPSGTFGPYYYRYYSQTNAYLGTSSADLNVYYLGAQSGSGVINAGATSTWLTTTACVNAASPANSWTFDAAIFSTYRGDFGGTQGILADVTVLPLSDGRYRMFIGDAPVTPATPRGIHSAISSDGVSFTLESGPRVVRPYPTSATTAVQFIHPHVVRMDDGRVRLFVSGGGGISSLTSADDGMTFTLDTGLRIRAADVGVTRISGPSIVKMKTGGWRMYFSELNPNSVDPTTGHVTLAVNRIFSAFSTDLLTWAIDSGVRAGPGSAITNSGSAEHPGSIANDDGSVTLIYFRNIHEDSSGSSLGLWASTATDGLNFTSEAPTPFLLSWPRVGVTPPTTYTWSTIGPGGDPFLMRLNTGEVRIYYNSGDDTGGAIYTARHPPFSVSTSP